MLFLPERILFLFGPVPVRGLYLGGYSKCASLLEAWPVISVPQGPRISIHYLLMKSIGSVVGVSICVGHVAAGESTKLSHLVSHHIALSSSSAATPT